MSSPRQAHDSRRPSRLELDCLHVLWQASPATVEQVRSGLPRPLAHTTVMTLLNRLAAKRLVTRAKQGRAWTYAAAVEHESARAEALRQVLAQWFGNDPQALLRELGRLGGGAGRPLAARAPAARASGKGKRETEAEDEQFRPAQIDESLL